MIALFTTLLSKVSLLYLYFLPHDGAE